jgi:hypothetical protein
MAKMTCLKNTESTLGNQKFVFVNIEKPSTQGTGGGPAGGTLTERIEKKLNTSLNVDSKFGPDFNTVLEDLGRKAKEKNPALSAESIRQNFSDALAPGKTPDEVWAYLQKEKCQTAEIVDGRL